MDRNDVRSITASNRDLWDGSAHLHGTGPGWERLLRSATDPGFSVLDGCLTATLTGIGVEGRTVVQVGCNNARELLSVKSLGGIPALGIDQSRAFLRQGTALFGAAGVPVRLLEANIYELPDVGAYDVCLITIGVLGWLPDLPRLFAVVAGLLHPGGHLVIYETHPFLEMFDPSSEAPFTPRHSYFDTSALPQTGAITYDGSDGGEAATGYWFRHPMGEIVMACVASGLALRRLDEHRHSNRETPYDIYKDQQAQLPLSFTMVAQRV